MPFPSLFLSGSMNLHGLYSKQHIPIQPLTRTHTHWHPISRSLLFPKLETHKWCVHLMILFIFGRNGWRKGRLYITSSSYIGGIIVSLVSKINFWHNRLSVKDVSYVLDDPLLHVVTNKTNNISVKLITKLSRNFICFIF